MLFDVGGAEWNADARNANAADKRAVAAGRFRTLRRKSRPCRPDCELCQRKPNADDVHRGPASENAILTDMNATLPSRSTSLRGMTRTLRDEVGLRHRRSRC
jgi:hypothetical protein